jgi:hypothetical protein
MAVSADAYRAIAATLAGIRAADGVRRPSRSGPLRDLRLAA